MLQPRVRQATQVIGSLLVAIWIFWFLYKDIELSHLILQIRTSNWSWIFLSLLISWAGYWLRGWRWALLIREEGGVAVSTNRAYHAVMVGYLANMVIPRAGEVARCGMLARSNGKSMGHLLGTVILERSIDLLFLIGTIFLAFLIENELFRHLAGQLIDLNSLGQKLLANLPLLLGGLVVAAFFVYLVFRKFRSHGLVNKLQEFFRQLISGLRSISSLRNPFGFWISSLVIWIIYFLTMYTVSIGIQSTANLTAGEVLLVMVMGSIGMIAPVQGGIGTFHALVAYILIQFGVSEADGKIFAVIIHGTQVLMILVLGLISWLVIMRLPVWAKPDKP